MRNLLIMMILFFARICSVESATSKIPYYMIQAAHEFGLDPVLLYSIAKVESNLNPDALNRNDGNSYDKKHGIIKKSYGLFQIQHLTAKGYGFNENPNLLLSAQVNTTIAAKHLNHLYERYGSTYKVISAYNAGHYSQKNKSYVDKVIKHYILYKIDGRYQ